MKHRKPSDAQVYILEFHQFKTIKQNAWNFVAFRQFIQSPFFLTAKIPYTHLLYIKLAFCLILYLAQEAKYFYLNGLTIVHTFQ